MKLPGVQRIRQVFRQVAPKALILLYHRVAASTSDPQLLCVTPEHFSEHLQILRQYFHPLSLMNLQKRRAFNLWPSRSVVVTFDDGYADNFYQARPSLEAKEIPATVFVTSGRLNAQQEFWWDELERIFLLHPMLPDRLEIRMGNNDYVWELGEVDPPLVSASWNVLAGTQPTPRQQVYLDLMKILHNVDVNTREQVISQLFAWAGIETSPGRQGHFAVSADELQGLPKDGLIEVGAHTVNHSALSALSLDDQRTEIIKSKSTLEEILGHPVFSFAYPFGERRDYTLETVKLVRQAGFVCACSNFAGHVTALSDPYQLPRYVVRNWDGETFARRLENWFRG